MMRSRLVIALILLAIAVLSCRDEDRHSATVSQIALARAADDESTPAAPTARRELGAFEAAFLEFGDGRCHVIDRAGGPVPGARAWLVVDWRGWPRPSEIAREFTTDADGCVDLGELPEPVGRTYLLVAHKPGYAVGLGQVSWLTGDATVVLFPPSDDTVTLTMPDGSPAANVTLRLSGPAPPRQASWAHWLPESLSREFTVETDDRGSTVLSYDVAAWYRGRWMAEGPGIEPYSLGLDRQKQLLLDAAPLGLGRRARRPEGTCRITSRVVNEHGRPVAGAYVEATHENRDFSLFWPVTDEDGRYELQSPPGEVRLLVLDAPEPYLDSRQLTDDVITVTGEEGTVTAFARPHETVTAPDFVLQRAVTVSGVVRDTEGDPVAGAEVLTSGVWAGPKPPAQSPPVLSPPTAAITGADGRFEFFAHLPGRRMLIGARTTGAASPEPREITLERGLSVDLTVDPAAAAWIEGRVTDEQGQAFDRAVAVLFAPRPMWSSLGPRPIDIAPVSADGSYRFGPLIAGTYAVSPAAPYQAVQAVGSAWHEGIGGWGPARAPQLAAGETFTADFVLRAQPEGE